MHGGDDLTHTLTGANQYLLELLLIFTFKTALQEKESEAVKVKEINEGIITRCQQPPFKCLRAPWLFQWESGNAYIEEMSDNILSRLGARGRTKQHENQLEQEKYIVVYQNVCVAKFR